MIGLDTNVLLRAVANDDAVQTPLARRRLAKLTAENPGVVNSVVLAEFAWVLRSAYSNRQNEIADAIDNMLRSPAYHFPDRDAVNAALVRCRDESLQFADALIGELNRAAGCGSTLTFDDGAARSSAFELLE